MCQALEGRANTCRKSYPDCRFTPTDRLNIGFVDRPFGARGESMQRPSRGRAETPLFLNHSEKYRLARISHHGFGRAGL